VKTTTKQPNKIRRFQRGIYKAAKISPNRRFAVLYDKVYRKDILQTAWQKVRAGGKAAGVDKMTVKHIEYEIGVQNFLEDIENELKSQAYKPQLIRRVNIPKGNGKTRPLGIPTVRDKVVQMAVKIVIEPLFECDFCDCSYGFRPKRSNQQAANEVHRISNHNKWIVDLDLKAYFDTIDHDCLMDKLRKRISDKRILHLIRQWLKAGILEQDGSTIQTDRGTPQGGVLTPPTQSITLSFLLKLSMKENFQNIAQNVGEIVNKSLQMTYKVLYLCHYEKINNDRIYQKNQFCGQDFISRRNSFGGKTGVSEGIQDFRKTGISLLKICGKYFRATGGAGEKIGLYCKIANQPYSTDQKKSKRFRSQLEFSRSRSIGNLPENRWREWNEKKKNAFLNLNTTMTGWGFRNSAWSISFLFPTLICQTRSS
jgi:retron-type reverse transcriptase